MKKLLGASMVRKTHPLRTVLDALAVAHDLKVRQQKKTPAASGKNKIL